MVEITEGLTEGQTVYYQEAYDPYAYYYGTGGNASGGDAWIETRAAATPLSPRTTAPTRTASRWKDNAMIDLHDVSRSTRSARRVHALDHVTLHIFPEGFVSVIGYPPAAASPR